MSVRCRTGWAWSWRTTGLSRLWGSDSRGQVGGVSSPIPTRRKTHAVPDPQPMKHPTRHTLLSSTPPKSRQSQQDHRRIKRLVRPGLGFKRFRTAWRTLVGYETLAMMRKGQVKGIGGNDIVAHAAFVNSLFDMVA